MQILFSSVKIYIKPQPQLYYWQLGLRFLRYSYSFSLYLSVGFIYSSSTFALPSPFFHWNRPAHESIQLEQQIALPSKKLPFVVFSPASFGSDADSLCFFIHYFSRTFSLAKESPFMIHGKQYCTECMDIFLSSFCSQSKCVENTSKMNAETKKPTTTRFQLQ